jgi:uncharacterized protein
MRNMAHYPYPVPVDSYGNGGFRFGEMSHKGSLLFLPNGVWSWDIRDPDILNVSDFSLLLEAGSIEHLVVGMGAQHAFLSPALRAFFQQHAIHAETMTTFAAARTYNILLLENRPVAAALIAV